MKLKTLKYEYQPPLILAILMDSNARVCDASIQDYEREDEQDPW